MCRHIQAKIAASHNWDLSSLNSKAKMKRLKQIGSDRVLCLTKKIWPLLFQLQDLLLQYPGDRALHAHVRLLRHLQGRSEDVGHRQEDDQPKR